MDTILVSIDDQPETADVVLREAAELAAVTAATLCVLHVAHRAPPMPRGGPIDMPNETLAYAEEVAQRGAARATQFGVVGATWAGARGETGETICKAAEKLEATLIVMGSRGRGPLTGAVLGSVAQHVSSCAPCSVVIAR